MRFLGESAQAITAFAFVSIVLVSWLGNLAPAGGLIGPITTQTYRHLRGRSSGEEINRLFSSTERRFRTIARGIPGRIDRSFASD